MMPLSTSINSRILIVDDNESIHSDFQKILRATDEGESTLAETEAALFGDTQSVVRVGFELASAYQGQQALEMVLEARQAQQPFAMAFVDMRMPPGWDGIETIEQLWKVDPQLQIVICSAYADYTWDDVTRRLDLRDRLLILKKPFDNIEIHQLASALTAKWQMEHDAEARVTRLEQAVEERTRNLQRANEALQAEVRQRQRLEGQLALRQKLESIGQLAAGVAHEINTPIQYVGDSVHFLRSAFHDLRALQERYERFLSVEPGSVQAELSRTEIAQARTNLDVDFLEKEVPRACERALSGVERVSAIVRAMKEFAHPGTDEHTPADINEALKTTLLVAGGEYKYVANVEMDLSDLPPVTCDIGALNQVFLNLIVNAAHAIESAGRDPTTGRITIRTDLRDDDIVVSIGDNGTGVPKHIVEKVFDPFFTTKEVGRGTGQGLAIAHTIVVVNHGGTIRFESTEGAGTTFFITLPIARAETPQMCA